MEQADIFRKLAAILAADVVGYSRLMGLDEVGTLNALKAHRRELIDPTIAAHRGRIVKTTGDGLLLEFASVVDAVGCAIAVQRAMLARNADVAQDRRIVFRIGINVGDIIIDGDDIFGDGVNVAARLETICEPGGVCISRSANEQVRDKLSLGFNDLGEQTVKNIARAIGVFGLAASDIAALPEPPAVTAPLRLPLAASVKKGLPRAWLIGSALAFALVVAAGVALLPMPPAATPAGPGPAGKRVEADELFWNSIRGRNDPTELRAYLDAYPDGEFKNLARARLDKIASDAAKPAPQPVKPPPPPAAAAPKPPAAPDAAPVNPQAHAALVAILTSFAVPNPDVAAANFLVETSGVRALAVAPNHHATWRVGFSSPVNGVEELALERCQIAYDEPCVLVASGAQMQLWPSGGWRLNDMPRVRYAGAFDPAQIPGVRSGVRDDAGLQRYLDLKGPKAMAIHAGGSVYWHSDADPRAAQELALKNCAEAPNRTTRSVPCYLYAIDEQVVLPQRLTAAKPANP